MKQITVAAIMSLLLLGTALADDKAGGEAPRELTISFVDQDVKKVVTTIARFAGANVIISPAVEGKVSVQFESTPWLDALRATAAEVGATVTETDHGIYRVTPVAKPAKSTPASKVISVSFDDQEIVEVISTIAEFAKLNVIVSPKVKGKVTLRLHDVPAKVALKEVARTLGFVVTEENEVVLIAVRTETAREKSKLFTMTAADMEVRRAISTLADFGGLNVIMGERVEGKISFQFDAVPLRDALDEMVKSAGCVVREEVPGILRIEKRP